jgi:hypothetical protein
MIVCARCGAANEPSSKFCPSCGASLSTAGTKSSEAGPAPLPPLPPLGAAGPGPGAAAPGFGQPQNWPPPPLNQPPASPAAAAALGHAPTGLSQAFPDQAEPNARFRIGAPEGLNPFSATVSPQNAGALGPTPFTPFSSPDAPGPAPAPLPPLDPPFGGAPSPFNPPGGTPAFGSPPPAAPPAFGQQPPASPFGQQPAPAPFAAPQPAPAFGAAQQPAPAFAPPEPPAPAFAPPQPVAPAFSPPAQAPGFAPAQAPYAPPPRLDPVAPVVDAPRNAAGPGRDPESVEAGAMRVLAGFLVSFEYELGQFWPLYQGQNVVGRRDAAPGLDVQIDHPTTSSRHAVIYASARPGRLKVEDVGSTNGTQLGEMQLERGRKYELKDGDTIRFGGYSLVVKLV